MLETIQGYWQYLLSNRQMLWLLVVAVLALLVFIGVLIWRTVAKKKRLKGLEYTQPLTFVPVDPNKGTSEIFLPLADKLVVEAVNSSQLSPILLQKIRESKPGCLEEILQALPKVNADYGQSLRQAIADEKLLHLYARSLGQANYQPYSLAQAWQECPDPSVLPIFVDLLSSKEENIQMAAVRLLITLKEPACLTYLASAILQPHRYVPARVAEVLVAMGDSASWLLCYLLSEVEAEHKPMILSVLGQMQPGYPLDQIIGCLNDADEQSRRAAAACLGMAKAVAALPELIKAAQDESWAVRAAVACSLGQIGEIGTRATLQQLTNDEVWTVAVNAHESLRNMEVAYAAKLQ